MLAHNALPKQPDGVLKEKNESFSLFFVCCFGENPGEVGLIGQIINNKIITKMSPPKRGRRYKPSAYSLIVVRCRILTRQS